VSQGVEHLFVGRGLGLELAEQGLATETEGAGDGVGADLAGVQQRQQHPLDHAADSPLILEVLQQAVGQPGQDAEHVARLKRHRPGGDTRVEPQGVPAAGEGHRALEDAVVLGAPGRRRVGDLHLQHMGLGQEATRAADQPGECPLRQFREGVGVGARVDHP
jgi:hypothetical protein